MTSITNADRERMRSEQAVRELQRVEHLVLGRSRPSRDEHSLAKPRKGRKGRKVAARISRPITSVILAPGIEERVALRERWSHKQGTPETHEHVDQARRRPGSIARLWATGVIDDDQLAAAEQIAEAYRMITADVAVRTSSLEPGVDGTRHGRVEEQQLGRLRADLSYGWWRDTIGGCGEALLSVIVHDIGLTIVAREHGISMPRARRMLTDALDLWPRARQWTGRIGVPLALARMNPIHSDTVRT